MQSMSDGTDVLMRSDADDTGDYMKADASPMNIPDLRTDADEPIEMNTLAPARSRLTDPPCIGSVRRLSPRNIIGLTADVHPLNILRLCKAGGRIV